MNIWEKTLYKGQSEYNGEVKVVENSGYRRLLAHGYIQSQGVRADGRVGHPLWEKLIPPKLSLNQDSRVLLLGLGAGTVAKLVTKKFGKMMIDGVEIDQLIIDLARKYFGMNGPNLNIFVEDAGKFVKEARYKYDFICVDIFEGKRVPKKIESKEFLNAVKNLLKDDGLVSINKIFFGRGEQEKFEGFVREIFPKVDSSVLRGGTRLDNIIVYASR